MAVKSTSIERTPLVEALRIVIQTLENTNEERPFTLKEISRETGLNPRTVRKTILLLEQMKQFLKHKDMQIIKGGLGTLVLAEEKKTKMLELPDDIQKFIIRTKYFPQPSREDEIQVYLYSRKAFDDKSAVFLEVTPIVRKLMKQDRIGKTRGEEQKFYLTDIGRMVALGAVDIYPELEKIIGS